MSVSNVGLLLTGGSLKLFPNITYYNNTRYLFQKALKANEQGDYFPIWVRYVGVCHFRCCC